MSKLGKLLRPRDILVVFNNQLHFGVCSLSSLVLFSEDSDVHALSTLSSKLGHVVAVKFCEKEHLGCCHSAPSHGYPTIAAVEKWAGKDITSCLSVAVCSVIMWTDC